MCKLLRAHRTPHWLLISKWRVYLRVKWIQIGEFEILNTKYIITYRWIKCTYWFVHREKFSFECVYYVKQISCVYQWFFNRFIQILSIQIQFMLLFWFFCFFNLLINTLIFSAFFNSPFSISFKICSFLQKKETNLNWLTILRNPMQTCESSQGQLMPDDRL